MMRVSGKIYGARHRSVRYSDGNDRKTGYYLHEKSSVCRGQIDTTQGVVGLYIRCLKKGNIPGDYTINHDSYSELFELKLIN